MNKDEFRTFMARSYSSGTPGRAICNSRNHHFIADEFGCDEVTAGEYFLTGLTACAVNLLERVAKESHVPLRSLDVRAEGTYKRNLGEESRTLFHEVKMRFQFLGVSDDDAQTLVATYHKRCPLYGTVATATPEMRTTIVVDAG
jgi:uncharacterized OsmC-like protein